MKILIIIATYFLIAYLIVITLYATQRVPRGKGGLFAAYISALIWPIFPILVLIGFISDRNCKRQYPEFWKEISRNSRK